MFDNNDFLNSYKKNLDDSSQPGANEPEDEAPGEVSGTDVQDNLPEEEAPVSEDIQQNAGESAPEASGEKSKFVWGGKPSHSDESGASAGEPAAPAATEAPADTRNADIPTGNEEHKSLAFDIPSQQPEIKGETAVKDAANSQAVKTTAAKTALPAQPAAAKQMSGKAYEEKSTFVKPQPQYHERRYYDGYEPPKKPVLKNVVIAAVCVLAVIIIIVLIASNAGKVEVKDFSGWARADFMLWASENEVLTQIDEEFNEQVAADKIISQSIVAGEKVKKGDFVRVAVSKGPDLSITLALPDLMNMTNDQVEQWAAQNFMTKVRITTEFNATVPAGYVIKYEINDNTVLTEVRRDTPIYVYISKGPQDQTSIEVEIPDFKTMGISETVLFAQANGLSLTINEQYDDYVPKNSIISQDPKPKVKAHVGDTVKVIVSLGKKILMPDFSGLTKEQAIALAGELGINATFGDRYSSTKEGNFSYQTVDPGVEVMDDTTVTVYYSIGNKIPIVSYVGQQVNQLEQWMETVNAKDAKLTLTKTYTQSSALSGVILQQNKENTFITKGTAITVVVSSGEKIFVPNFVAASPSTLETAVTREEAQQMCKDVGLVPIFIEASVSGRQSGEIWSQSIAAGTEVKQGSTIELKYNTVQQSIILPDFTGKTEAQVRAMPQFSQVLISFVSGDTYLADYESKVYSQSIAADTPVPINTAITLTLGKVKIIDFTGKTEAEVRLLYPDNSKLAITYTGIGVVSAQSAAIDTLVTAGTAITLTLS